MWRVETYMNVMPGDSCFAFVDVAGGWIRVGMAHGKGGQTIMSANPPQLPALALDNRKASNLHSLDSERR